MSLLGSWPHFAYNLAELAAVVQSQKTDAGIKWIEFKIFRDCSYTAKTKKKPVWTTVFTAVLSLSLRLSVY